MDEHKKVRVTVNRDEQPSPSKKHELEYFLTPKQKKSQGNFMSSNKPVLNKLFKPIAFAVILGVIFGLGFIAFFSDLNPADNTDSAPVFNEDEEEDEEVTDTETPAESGEQFERTNETFEVIQYGIFSTNDNARELSQSLLQQTVPTIIHEEEGQYYVLSMVDLQPYNRDEVTNWLEAREYEYMNDFLYKDWQINDVLIEGSEAEINWLQEGDALITAEMTGSVWLEEVSGWLNEAPERFENDAYLNNLTNLVNQFEQQITENELPIYLNTVKLSLLLFFENNS